jgi:hypothetical protein
MHAHLLPFLTSLFVTAVTVTAIAALLSVAGSLSPIGRRLIDLSIRAPLLDFWVAAMTWLPWVIAAFFCGWVGFLGALIGEMIAMGLWCMGHEMAHREAARGPRIVKFINKTVGRWRNHLALWVTLVALPGFWFIRFLQVISYWPLVVLLGFPKYKQSEWVNVSRQKFSGLVGHDLVWCLYCDWMTGVYSLGAEMLRNVESFWCPIRFYDGKKCANCRTDFPDIEHGWVAPTGNMADVEKTMEDMYGHGHREWFGHPARLTVKGVDPSEQA